jgi:hypothetical protein
MNTPTATAAQLTDDAAVSATKTKRVECVVLTEASLLALPIFAIRASASTGSVAGFVRDGRNYVAPSDYVEKLRVIRAGKPAAVVFAKLIEQEARDNFEREAPMREAIAAADAKCAAERAAREAAQLKAAEELREREKRKAGPNYVDARGVIRNALGDRVV